MRKQTNRSRRWYNLCANMRSWLKLTSKWFKEASREYEGDAVDDQIKFDTKINKTLGIPPTNKWCEKNPNRFL